MGRNSPDESQPTVPGQMSRRDASLVRGLKILNEIAESGESTVRGLSDVLDLPLSTTYRYVKVLREFELVVEDDGRVLPSSRLHAWSGGEASRSHLLDVGVPFLKALSARTGRTSVLVVREGRNAACLRQVASIEDVDIAFRTYEVLPLDKGAGQRVLLAHAPPQIIAEVAGAVADRDALLASLRQIRACGYAVSQSELRAGAIALSRPVTVRGEILCSLTLAGRAERLSGATVAALRPILATATAQLETELLAVC